MSPGVLSTTGKPPRSELSTFLPSSPPTFLYTHALPVIRVSLLLLGLDEPSPVSMPLSRLFAHCFLSPGLCASEVYWTSLPQPPFPEWPLPPPPAPLPILPDFHSTCCTCYTRVCLSVCPRRTSAPEGGLGLGFVHSWRLVRGKHSANTCRVNEHPPSCFHGSGLLLHPATSRLVVEGQMRMIDHP